jgi:hypothetical protein
MFGTDRSPIFCDNTNDTVSYVATEVGYKPLEHNTSSFSRQYFCVFYAVFVMFDCGGIHGLVSGDFLYDPFFSAPSPLPKRAPNKLHDRSPPRSTAQFDMAEAISAHALLRGVPVKVKDRLSTDGKMTDHPLLHTSLSRLPRTPRRASTNMHCASNVAAQW